MSINFTQRKKTIRTLIYQSGLLSYGDHTIKIQGTGEIIDLYKFAYWPSIKAKRINFTNIPSNVEWPSESDNIGGFSVSTTSNDDYKSTTIKCSKFWVYGSFGPNLGSVVFNIDGIDYTFSEYSEKDVVNTLVYESKVLPYKNHTFIIKGDQLNNQKIVFNSIYYIPEQFPIPTPVPISVGIDEMYKSLPMTEENTKCETIDCHNYIDENTHKCGKRCWSRGNHLQTFEYTFKGERFQVYGKYAPDHGTFDLYIDEITKIIINTTK